MLEVAGNEPVVQGRDPDAAINKGRVGIVGGLPVKEANVSNQS